HDGSDRHIADHRQEQAGYALGEVVVEHLETRRRPRFQPGIDLLHDPTGQGSDEHGAQELGRVAGSAGRQLESGATDHAHSRHCAEDTAPVAVHHLAARVGDQNGQEVLDRGPDDVARDRLPVPIEPALRETSSGNEQRSDQTPRDERADVGDDHPRQPSTEALKPLFHGLLLLPPLLRISPCSGEHRETSPFAPLPIRLIGAMTMCAHLTDRGQTCCRDRPSQHRYTYADSCRMSDEVRSGLTTTTGAPFSGTSTVDMTRSKSSWPRDSYPRNERTFTTSNWGNSAWIRDTRTQAVAMPLGQTTRTRRPGNNRDRSIAPAKYMVTYPTSSSAGWAPRWSAITSPSSRATACTCGYRSATSDKS